MAEIEHRRARLSSDVGEGIAQERIEAAKAALAEGDPSLADKIFAEVEAMEQASIDRAAEATFQRGVIAEQEIRWADAAEHYARAAQLAPTYDRLFEARQLAWLSGDLTRAAYFGQELLGVAGEQFGEEAPEYATALIEHAITLYVMGRYAEAEPLFQKAIEIENATIGEAHPEYATHLNNLAGLLKEMGRIEAARDLLSEAVNIRREALGENPPDHLRSLWWEADFARADGDYDPARKSYAAALDDLKYAFGVQHPRTQALGGQYASLLREHFPDDPTLTESEAALGPHIGKVVK